jgi:hypothetical protein
MATITGANANITIAIGVIFPAPQQLQGWATDDVYETEAMAIAEVLEGVDGVQSAGLVRVPVRQTFVLQADSPSNAIFDQWYTFQYQTNEIVRASGLTTLPGVKTQWTSLGGVLVSYQPMPSVKKLMQPRRYTISWATIYPTPTQ